MVRLLNLAGLLLTLIGAALLFFYGIPKKAIGNVAFIGDTAMKWEAGPEERDIPTEEWQREFDAFRNRTVLLNRAGFALVSAGTLLQLLAAW